MARPVSCKVHPTQLLKLWSAQAHEPARCCHRGWLQTLPSEQMPTCNMAPATPAPVQAASPQQMPTFSAAPATPALFLSSISPSDACLQCGSCNSVCKHLLLSRRQLRPLCKQHLPIRCLHAARLLHRLLCNQHLLSICLPSVWLLQVRLPRQPRQGLRMRRMTVLADQTQEPGALAVRTSCRLRR